MSAVTALAKIEAAEKKGALVFVDREWIEEKTPLYKPEVTEMKIDKTNDCFSISGKFMPKREVVDRIGDANGIDFIFGEVKPMTIEDDMCGKRIVYSAKAQGRKRMSDGSWRTSSIQDYDFDPVLRGMLDFDATELNAQTKQKQRIGNNGKPYGSNLAKYILELQKVAPQRANTGARLRVIRELVGMPVAFAEKEIENPLVFGRIIQNTEYILKTPEGRAMATAKALDVDMSTLFGGRKLTDQPATHQETNYADMTPANETPPENNASSTTDAAASNEPDFPDEPTGPGSQQEVDVFKEKSLTIEQLMITYKDALDVLSKNGKNPYKMAQDELANPNATIESRDSMIDRLHTWLRAKGINP